MPSAYNHPKIFSDLLIVYKKYYASFKNFPKFFRLTIGTEIMKELTECLKLITVSNFKKDDKNEVKQAVLYLKNIRSRIEILKTYFLISWETKIFSHGFYTEIIEKMEEISKQAASWEKWLKSRQ